MSLSRGEYWLLGGGQSTSGTYCLISTTRTFAVPHLTMRVGNDGVSVRNITPGDGFFRSVPTSVKTGRAWFYPKFGLEVESQRSSYGGDGTHVKDMKNPVEV